MNDCERTLSSTFTFARLGLGLLSISCFACVLVSQPVDTEDEGQMGASETGEDSEADTTDTTGAETGAGEETGTETTGEETETTGEETETASEETETASEETEGDACFEAFYENTCEYIDWPTCPDLPVPCGAVTPNALDAAQCIIDGLTSATPGRYVLAQPSGDPIASKLRTLEVHEDGTVVWIHEDSYDDCKDLAAWSARALPSAEGLASCDTASWAGMVACFDMVAEQDCLPEPACP